METYEEYRRWNTCDRKRPYRAGVARHKIKIWKQKGIRLQAYECPYCGKWHLAKDRRKS